MAFAGWLIGLGLFNILSAIQASYFLPILFQSGVGAGLFAWAGYEIEKKLR